MLRNNYFPLCHLQFIIELRKAVTLSQIFFPKLDFSRSFLKEQQSCTGRLLWHGGHAKFSHQGFNRCFGTDIFVLIRIMDPYHWFTDLDPALFFKSFQDVNVLIFCNCLLVVQISLHRRQVGILYLKVTRPKLTVLAPIHIFNDDINASLLLISLFLHSLHSCCFWLRGSFDHNFTIIKYVKFAFFVRLFSSTWDTSHLAVWAAS